MKRKTKKIVSVVMLILILLTSLPLQTFATFITDINSNAKFGIISNSLGQYGHELHFANYDGATYLLFCTQYGKTSPNGQEYTYSGDFIPQFKNQRLEYERIAEYIYFGYTMKYGMGLPTSIESQRAACATQQFVWEYIHNNIDRNQKVPSRDSWNGNYMSSSIYTSWLAQTENLYNQYHRNVSFNNTNNKIDIGGSTTFKDTNGVLQYYSSFNQEVNGITFSHRQGSNELVVNVPEDTDTKTASFISRNNGIYQLMPNGASYNSSTMANYVYIQFTNGTVQDLIFSNYVDPSNFAISVEIQSGKVQIKKVNTIGDVVAGCSFALYKDENCTQKVGTGTTTDDGTVLFDKLKVGTYFVKEVSVPTGYLLDTTIQRVIVKNGETAVVNFTNEEPTGSINIVKKDIETGSVAQGDATFKDAVYKVYANEDIYNVAKTKKFYSRGDLVATRTMDSNGKTSILDKLPLGKYIVKEDTAPKGYMLDHTIYNVELKYKDQYTEVITNETTSNELVKKMGVHIFKSGIKENSGETPGLQNAEFTIKLNSHVQKAYQQGYSYAEVWNGIDENGNKIEVNSTRVTEAQKIAPTYATLVTDKDGNAYTQKNLPYGKYIVKETRTPKDYETASDFYFSITQDESEIENVAQKTKHLVVNNEQLEAYIKLVKQDLKTGKIVTLNSATFEIKATKDIYDRATGKIIWKKGENISQKIGSKIYTSFTTNSKNMIVPENSFENKYDTLGTVVTPLTLPVGSYQINEIMTPNGFLQLEKPVTFKIEGIRDYDKDQDEDFIKEIVIKNDKPTGTLIVDKHVALRKDIDTSIVDISDLSKIEFSLTAKEDIIDYSDGSIIYKKGQLVKNYYLDKKGDLKVEELPMGIYELQEIKTLDGLVLNSKKYEIKFEQKDLVTKVYEVKEDIFNDTTVFEFSKTDITGEQELIGAKLTVIDENDKVVDSWTSTEKTHKIEGLVVGKEYTLKEETAPNGFVVATEIKFRVESTTEIQKATMIDKIVEISKQDIAGNELEGATLVVTSTKTKNIVDKWVSGKEAHKVNGLIENEEYILHEEIVVNGYVKATDVKFTVTSDKETQKVIMIDKVLEVIKTDLVTGEEIEGAELKVIDEDGNVIDEWTSTKEPHRVVGLEENKKYKLVETTAPYGYEITEEIEFTVSENKETQRVEMKDMPILQNIKLVKIDSNTKEIIKDKFTFGLYEDEECTKLIKEVKSDKENGTVLFEDLRYGVYYIKEITAPKGYVLSDKVIKVEMNDKGTFIDNEKLESEDSTYTFEFENVQIGTPKTGDNSNLKLYAGLLGLSILALASVGVHEYKKRKSVNKK